MDNDKELTFYWKRLGKQLSKSDKETIKKIVTEYYENKAKVKDIVAKYHLNILNSKLVSEFPPIVTDEKCKYDDELMIVDPHSRDSLGLNGEPYCPVCGHKNLPYCRCKNCLEKEKKYLQGLRDKIRETYLIPKEKTKVKDLTVFCK